jgi:uncharacterized protein (TIGR02147 family)
MSLFKESDYKAFLKKYLANLPKRGRGEIGRMAQYLRVSSTLISQILSGNKHLSLEQAEGIAEYLALPALEADYFILLVHHERAGTVALKKYYDEKIKNLKDQALKVVNRVEAKKSLTDIERAVFYSSPLYAGVWLFTSVGKDGKSIDDIMKRFDLPRVKILEIIKFLVETQLCIEKNGYYTMGGQSTHVEQGSPHLLHHYRNWRLKAIEQSENLNEEELMYTAAVSLSKKDFEILREEMVSFIKSFLKRTHESPAEEVACFNMDFFWIKK